MEAPSYPSQGGNTYVVPEPDLEHQRIQGGQDARRNRKRKIILIWTAAICCGLLLFVISPVIFLIVYFLVYAPSSY